MLKIRDCTVAFQIEGGCPVKPTSGNTGSPVPNCRDGTSTSLLSDRDARALSTSACAILTAVLLRWARSTTVANDTCAISAAGAAAISAVIARAKNLRRVVAAICNRTVPFRVLDPAPACTRAPGPEPGRAVHALRPYRRFC